MAHDATLKISRTKTLKKINRVEGNRVYVFIAPKRNEVYINIGGQRFRAKSDAPITFDEMK